jgi:uncharacterized OB-fold protein
MNGRPLPDISDPEFEPYFTGCAQHELRLPHCASCGWWQWPPRSICPRCLADTWSWDGATETATLYSWTTIWRPGLPGFDDQVPFAVVVVELDMTPKVRMLGNSVDCRPDELAIGLPMDVVFRHVADKVILPFWRPVPSKPH